MIKLQKETEAAILAWIRSQNGNHRAAGNHLDVTLIEVGRPSDGHCTLHSHTCFFVN